MPEPAITYAWCFSHGCIHWFRPSAQDPDGAWCTANWMRLDGATEEDALKDKQARFGDAQFDHHLPPETRLLVIEACGARWDDDRHERLAGEYP
jgi:hypothetical protein